MVVDMTRSKALFASGISVTLFVACGDDGGTGDTNATTQATTQTSDGGSQTATAASTDGAGTTDPDGTTSLTGPPDPDTGTEDTASSTGAAGVGCDAGDYLVCEDFEGAPLGGFPDGWDLRPSGVFGGNSMGVTDNDAALGGQSLQIESGSTGAQWLTYMGDISALADGHWGRMYFKMGTPTPWPAGGVIHGDVFEARGDWMGSTHQVRWAAIENGRMMHNWGYNVQTSNAGEFIHETSYIYTWPEDWFCIEWQHDQGAQTATLWIDGEEVLAVTPGDDPQLPTFDDISIGWANYQAADPQFVVHIDEVILDDERIGCGR
jgi:hypothetical protein